MVGPDHASGVPVDTQEVFELFETTWSRATQRPDPQAYTVVLGTASKEAIPSVRTVYFGGVEAQTFSFCVDSNSGKAAQLVANPVAALCFCWSTVGAQVVATGAARKLEDDVADRLWGRRPRDQALQAWAMLAETGSLDERIDAARARFPHERVPRPPHWAAFGVAPERIEFLNEGRRRRATWQGFELGADGWLQLPSRN